MMGIVHVPSHKMTFIHIPRTGGSTVRRMILDNVKGSVISSLGDPDIQVKHPDINRARELFDDLGWTFTTVRNPYERFTSLYAHLKKVHVLGKMTFEHFVFKEANYETYAKPMSTWFEEGEVDCVMRYESLAEDFKPILKQLNVTTKLIHKNSSRSDHKKLLTPETKEFLYEKYMVDFERFKYEKDIS